MGASQFPGGCALAPGGECRRGAVGRTERELYPRPSAGAPRARGGGVRPARPRPSRPLRLRALGRRRVLLPGRGTLAVTPGQGAGRGAGILRSLAPAQLGACGWIGLRRAVPWARATRPGPRGSERRGLPVDLGRHRGIDVRALRLVGEGAEPHFRGAARSLGGRLPCDRPLRRAVLEDDFFRYLWDGYRSPRTARRTGSPRKRCSPIPSFRRSSRGSSTRSIPLNCRLFTDRSPGSPSSSDTESHQAAWRRRRRSSSFSTCSRSACCCASLHVARSSPGGEGGGIHCPPGRLCGLLAACCRTLAKRSDSTPRRPVSPSARAPECSPSFWFRFVLRPARPAHWMTFGGVLGVVYLAFRWQGGSDLPALCSRGSGSSTRPCSGS